MARDSFESFACVRQGQVPTLFCGALLGASVSGVVYPVTVFRFGVVRIHVFRCVCPVCLQSKRESEERESEEREREREKERERASESDRDTFAFRCSMLILVASVSYHVTHMRNIWWWCCVQMCPTILISSRTRWTWAQLKNAWIQLAMIRMNSGLMTSAKCGRTPCFLIILVRISDH